MNKTPETPRTGRQEYSAAAILHAGNDQYTCRLINVASSGLLLYAPRDLPKGTFLRLNLTLPGVEEVLDVDGVVVRRGHKEGHPVLGIKFFEPSPEFTATLVAFIRWLHDQKERRTEQKRQEQVRPARPARESLDHPAQRPRPSSGEYAFPPRSRAEHLLAQRMTGPHFPRVGTSDLRKAVETGAPAQGQPEGPEKRLKQKVEERWRRRDQETQSRKELREIYRQALRELERDPTTRGKPDK